MRDGKLCIEFEGEASLVDYDADGNLVHKQPLDPQVVCYAIRQCLVDALDLYMKHHEAQDQAEETEEG